MSRDERRITMKERLNEGYRPQEVSEATGTPRSTIYRLRKPPLPGRGRRPNDDPLVINAILELAREYPTYGYRRITAMLRRQGLVVNQKRVLRIMSEHKLLVVKRPRRALRTKTHGRITSDRPDTLWAGDLTKILTAQGWVYLVVYMDCYTREIVSWGISDRCRTQESLSALYEALAERKPEGLVLLTDNGPQFTSRLYEGELSSLGITHRRTAYNHPEANGMVERFFKSLKEEEVWQNEYASLEEARESVGAWISFYNRERPHMALKYRTPKEAYSDFFEKEKEHAEA